MSNRILQISLNLTVLKANTEITKLEVEVVQNSFKDEKFWLRITTDINGEKDFVNEYLQKEINLTQIDSLMELVTEKLKESITNLK